MGPLAGLKVIDLTHVMAGPTCTLMLADMGADVIKVEKTPQGDDSRHMIPPKIGEESAAFLMMNRNKRGVVIDLKTAGGKKVLLRLVGRADVLVENFAPGVMDRFGFAYDDVRAYNPAVIYCSLSGFGRSGPYRTRRGLDLIAQAMSGLMSVTGESSDRPPIKCGAPLSDITAGIIAALVQTYWQSAIALATGVAPRAMGSAHPLSAPYQAFQAADGWIVVGGANQRNWLRLLEALEANDLVNDPRFLTGSERMAHLAELESELAKRFRARPAAHWLAALEDKGVPCGPVNNVLQALADPQARAREMVGEVEHFELGSVQTLGLPVKFSRTPGAVRTGAPVYGEHTRAVLYEYGFEDEEIAALEREGAVVAAGALNVRSQKIA